MASIKEAYDSTMKEAFTGIKIFTWAFAIAYTIVQMRSVTAKLSPIDFICTNWTVTIIFFLKEWRSGGLEVGYSLGFT